MHSSKQAYMSDLEVKDLWFPMVFMQSKIFVAEKLKDLDKELGQYTGKKGGKPTTLCSSKWSNIMVLINTPYNNNNSHKGNNNIAIYGRVICAFTSSATTKSYYIFSLAFLTSFLMAKAKSQCCTKFLGKIAQV